MLKNDDPHPAYGMYRWMLPLMVLGSLLAGCGATSGGSTDWSQQAQPYPVVQLQAKDVTGQTSYPVRIEGIVNAEVRAKIPGYVTKVWVDEGARVQKGQPLFSLETDALSEEAEAAKANVEAAQVGVDQLRPLVEKKIVSPIQLQTAEAKLAQAKAAYKAITANIGYAHINSPITGYVGRIPYRQGSLIDPGNPRPLTTVSNTDEVFAYFSMNESDYLDFLQVAPGKTLEEKVAQYPAVKLKLANGEIFQHEGRIEAVTAQVDRGTGTVSFRATFPNPEHLIANGSSGTILIPKVYNNAVLVPQQSTYEMQGKTYVFKVLPDSTVTPVVIEVADEVDNLLVVRSGVDADTHIIAQGAGRLHDRDKVIPQPIPFDSLAKEITPVFQ